MEKTAKEKVLAVHPEAEYELANQTVVSDHGELGHTTLHPDATDAQHQESAWQSAALHESVAPSPLPVREQTPTRGKSLSAILAAVGAALAGKKVLLATARGNVKLERYAPQPEELTITVDEFVDAIAGEKEE